MHIYERRRIHLAEILEKMSVTELHKASGVAASSISSCLKQLPDGRYLRNIGEKTARKLEAGARKHEGWMDLPVNETSSNKHVVEESQPSYISNPQVSNIESAIETLRVALLSVDSLTRAQAKPIIDALFADPENGQELGARMSKTLEGHTTSATKKMAA